ncbi:SDR family NAD(P)-dependent oxidoreductase [Methylobrevis albus]|uniref:SDR family oxidoreductase n=1 Tax=Methylobrevis albus TaxID=2793297 RepID=A0A931MYL1_9HYPH|nr:SDR family oxidoreductase [Methylobrevis albus]MBH0238105.1 SDR family oxidoreductase [Methylobrevis albus]
MGGTGFAADLFAGRTVLVTGARSGIGAAVARGLLACGARVLAHTGRQEAGPDDDLFAGLAPDAPRPETFAADLAADGAAEALAAAIIARTDRLDGLINNAGTMLGRVAADAVDAAQFAKVVDLNARSAVLLTAGLLPLLRASGDAAIVNTVSISARTGGSPGSSLYSAAKAFVATWTRSLAKELAPDGIRVNAVSPGTIMTDFHRRYSTPEKLDATARQIPLARLGTPDDCTAAYLYLASPKLSGYVTGQTIEVNGGQLLA